MCENNIIDITLVTVNLINKESFYKSGSSYPKDNIDLKLHMIILLIACKWYIKQAVKGYTCKISLVLVLLMWYGNKCCKQSDRTQVFIWNIDVILDDLLNRTYLDVIFHNKKWTSLLLWYSWSISTQGQLLEYCKFSIYTTILCWMPGAKL